MTIVLIGERSQQSSRFGYILDNIQNCQIYTTNIEKNLNDQFEKIKGLKNEQLNQDIILIFEINTQNPQLQQKAISQLQKIYKQYKLFLLISDDLDRENAINIKNQLRYFNVSISNLLEFFQNNYDYGKYIDLRVKQIALLLGKEQDVKNTIFQTVKSPAILQNKLALINTPQFDMDSDFEIEELQQIFNRYQLQISLLFIIIDQERDDLSKKKFNIMYSFLRKFQKRIIVLLYNRFEEEFDENSNLNNYFINTAQIRKVYQLSDSQLKNQDQIKEYFIKILEEQQDLEIGIDIKDTIFQISDAKQSETEKQIFDEDFLKTKLLQLQQSLDSDDHQLIFYQQKIAEIIKSKQDKLSQINEIEIFQQEKVISKTQQEFQLHQQNQKELKTHQQHDSSIKNYNERKTDKKDYQVLLSEIQNLEVEKFSIHQQIEECSKRQDNINKSQKQLESQMADLCKKEVENDKRIRERKYQLEQQKQNSYRDSQTYDQKNNNKNTRIKNCNEQNYHGTYKPRDY